MLEEVEAVAQGTIKALDTQRNKCLDNRVEEEFRKRELKRIEKEEKEMKKEEKRGVSVSVQAQALPSKEEQVGKEFLELVQKFNLGVTINNINNYITNVKTYSEHSSDSEGTFAYKKLRRELQQEKEAEVSKRRETERKLLRHE